MMAARATLETITVQLFTNLAHSLGVWLARFMLQPAPPRKIVRMSRRSWEQWEHAGDGSGTMPSSPFR
jgi:hypothetical protein